MKKNKHKYKIDENDNNNPGPENRTQQGDRNTEEEKSRIENVIEKPNNSTGKFKKKNLQIEQIKPTIDYKDLKIEYLDQIRKNLKHRKDTGTKCGTSLETTQMSLS